MIAIGLNLILGMLLCCALVLGVRLERKLKGLRNSHDDFAKAVGELDGAAARTETSLHALRAGTEQAKVELTSRIDQARIACQRLEKLSTDAERIASLPLALAHPVTQAAPLAAKAPAFARPEPEALRPAAPVQTRPTPAPARSRAKLLDDDLFALEPPPPARKPAAQAAFDDEMVAESAIVERRAPERWVSEPAPEPTVVQFRPDELKADNDPLVGVPQDRSAREAFYREVLERGHVTPDPFDDGHFARERRVMLAAVMGGRR
jgi:Domain of unknown function (DUF6468)